jgi:hypothetical protein
MQLPINVRSPNNISKWQMEFNSAFKALMEVKSLTQLTAYRLFSEMLRVVTHVFAVNDFFYV